MYGRVYSKSPVFKKRFLHMFLKNLPDVWSTCAARYLLSAESHKDCILLECQDYQLSHKDCILQECQDKALRTASGNLSQPQMFTRLDKWSCRHMLAVVTAQDCAIM